MSENKLLQALVIVDLKSIVEQLPNNLLIELKSLIVNKLLKNIGANKNKKK